MVLYPGGSLAHGVNRVDVSMHIWTRDANQLSNLPYVGHTSREMGYGYGGRGHIPLNLRNRDVPCLIDGLPGSNV